MFVLIIIEGSSRLVINEILELLRLGNDILSHEEENKTILLMDILKATQVINWFLHNSIVEIKVRKARGDDLILFENNAYLKEFLYRHLNIREGQKWVVEQLPNNKYIALRRARPPEIRAYGMKEDIIEAESGKLTRIISIGSEVQLDEIDFRYAIQFA